jgi:hypothetical protein
MKRRREPPNRGRTTLVAMTQRAELGTALVTVTVAVNAEVTTRVVAVLAVSGRVVNTRASRRAQASIVKRRAMSMPIAASASRRPRVRVRVRTASLDKVGRRIVAPRLVGILQEAKVARVVTMVAAAAAAGAIAHRKAIAAGFRDSVDRSCLSSRKVPPPYTGGGLFSFVEFFNLCGSCRSSDARLA